jgi:hypothetical protein
MRRANVGSVSIEDGTGLTQKLKSWNRGSAMLSRLVVSAASSEEQDFKF